MAAAALTLAAAVTIGATGAYADPPPSLTTLANDDFTNATTGSSGWLVGNDGVSAGACLTASSNLTGTPIPGCASPAIDTPGSGALRLTNGRNIQVGTVFSTTSIPTTAGLDIRFNSYQYNAPGSVGGNGLGFMLVATDPANPSPPTTFAGQPGLGYSGSTGSPGVSHGYLGIGLDVFGNYLSSYWNGGAGCSGSWGTTPQNITVRGPGNGTTGYCVLGWKQLTSGSLDARTSTVRPSAVPVEIALNPKTTATTTASGLAVPARGWVISVTPIGGAQQTLSGSLPSVASLVAAGYPASWYDPTTGLPYQLSWGWDASSGGAAEIHELDQGSSSTLTGQLPVYALAMSDIGSGQLLAGSTATVDITPSLDPGEGSESEAATLTTTLPAGLTPSNPSTSAYACTTAGQVVSCVHTPASSVAAGTALPTLSIPVAVASSASGSRSIVAKISSRDANPISTTHTVVVRSLAASASPVSAGHGDPVTMAASNLPPNSTGAVVFTAGSTNLCTATLPATSCVTTAGLAPGSYAVTATYSGDGNYSGVTATTSLTVTQGSPSLSAAPAVGSVSYGTAGTLSFSGLPADATGSVTFTSGSTILCTVADVTTATGCQTALTLSPGSYPVTATYSGDGNYTAATANTSFAVDRAAPSLTATGPNGPVTEGNTATLSVTAPDGATGTISFTLSDGTALCTATLPATSCVATLSVPPGAYQVTAAYSGDPNFQAATTAFDLNVLSARTAVVSSATTVASAADSGQGLAATGLAAAPPVMWGLALLISGVSIILLTRCVRRAAARRR